MVDKQQGTGDYKNQLNQLRSIFEAQKAVIDLLTESRDKAEAVAVDLREKNDALKNDIALLTLQMMAVIRAIQEALEDVTNN